MSSLGSHVTRVSTIWSPHHPERVLNYFKGSAYICTTFKRAIEAAKKTPFFNVAPGSPPAGAQVSPSQAVKPTNKGSHRTSKAADVLFPAWNHKTHVSWIKPTGAVQGVPGSASTGLCAFFTAPWTRCSHPAVNHFIVFNLFIKA